MSQHGDGVFVFRRKKQEACSGADDAWDSHSGLKVNHGRLAAQADKPIAGLLTDLKQRGLIEDTVVLFATEFGRTPGSQGTEGRDNVALMLPPRRVMAGLFIECRMPESVLSGLRNNGAP